MKKNKKHTVTLSATSSIDKFPTERKNIKSIYEDNLKNETSKRISASMEPVNYNALFSDCKRNPDEFDIAGGKSDVLTDAALTAAEKTIREFSDSNHLLWDKHGNGISVEEHKKLIESTSEVPNHNYNKLDEDFNKKFTALSSSINNPKSNIGVFKDEKTFQKDYKPEETNIYKDDVYTRFHENMKTYPAYISFEGSRILLVAFATEQSLNIDHLPSSDIEIINKQLDKLENHRIDRYIFTVKLDNTKDFELYFNLKQSLNKFENAPITKQMSDEKINDLAYGKSTDNSLSSDEINDMISELEDDCDGASDKENETVKIRLFNTVIHSEPINTIGVPLSINGELLVEAKPIDVKVKDGTLELNGVAGRFKYLAGITNKEEFTLKNSSPHNVKLSNSNEPVIIKNKNAYEIRLSLVDTATEIVKLTKCGQVKTEEFVSEVLQAAKALYAFVENK